MPSIIEYKGFELVTPDPIQPGGAALNRNIVKLADFVEDVTAGEVSGVSGFSGYSGISGRSGYSGVSGYSGYSGISGYSGGAGESGTSGFSGSLGVNPLVETLSVNGLGGSFSTWTMTSEAGPIDPELRFYSNSNLQLRLASGGMIIATSYATGTALSASSLGGLTKVMPIYSDVDQTVLGYFPIYASYS